MMTVMRGDWNLLGYISSSVCDKCDIFFDQGFGIGSNGGCGHWNSPGFEGFCNHSYCDCNYLNYDYDVVIDSPIRLSGTLKLISRTVPTTNWSLWPIWMHW